MAQQSSQRSRSPSLCRREREGTFFLFTISAPRRKEGGKKGWPSEEFQQPKGEEVFFFPFTRADGSPSLPIPLFLPLTFFSSKATHGRGFFFPRPHRSIFPRPVSLNPSHEQSPPEFCLIAHEESGNPLANARPRASLWRRKRTLPFSGYQRHEFAGG